MVPEVPHFDTNVREILQELVMAEPIVLYWADLMRLVHDAEHEVFGPLEVLMSDLEVSDLVVKHHSTVFFERNGRLDETDIRFRD